MRPIRLEVSGFTAFREPVRVDFEGADLFALTGATGSGKSSLIDAMVFALYGSVPRLGRKLVAPVVSQGEVEARVRLDFAAGGETFSAVRIVRWLGPGKASTKEARLERSGEVLAGDARSVTEAVERVLGLGFEHFTKCVVLPQGEFARFLHDEPSARQDLLVKLLDLEAYGRMAQEANRIASEAAARAAFLDRRLAEDLAGATPQARKNARARLRTVEALWGKIEEAAPRLEVLGGEIDSARGAAREALDSAARLARVLPPEGTGDLAAGLASAQEALDGAARALKGAHDERRVAEEAIGALPPRADLEQTVAWHRDRAATRDALDKESARVADLGRAEAVALAAADEGARVARLASAERDAARRRNRALDLARTLVAGEACPVCRQAVARVPALGEAPDLEAAERAASGADRSRERAEKAHRDAAAARAAADARAAEIRERLAEIEGRLAGRGDVGAVGDLLARVAGAEGALYGARGEEERASKALAEAEEMRASLDAAGRAAWEEFERARDGVAALGAPPADRSGLDSAWAALAEWAAARAPVERENARAESERAARAESERDRIAAGLEAQCAPLGIEAAGGARDAVLRARERAEGEVKRIETAIEEAARARAGRDEAAGEHEIARALGLHLGAKGFEKWMLAEALGALVEGSTAILRELSCGQYSLALDEAGGFAVVDHRNADERRPAKTLSGGETFLASLALALALSENLAGMAAEGARLEAIFLDEGFGTLDAETLDTVASAIEGLAAAGRVVGLVTHLREVAERVPVRYEILKGPHTSTVSRVEA
ncbi:MAG: SMC family ATPase [Acidobacteria bacterium]|nr:SMC family ATPase [Acidobacteriota bacterium]